MGEREYILAGNYQLLDGLYRRLQDAKSALKKSKILLARAHDKLQDYASEISDNNDPIAKDIERFFETQAEPMHMYKEDVNFSIKDSFLLESDE